uniref:Rab-GAP TBC domain-containing protein n=1 Tax=Ditylenchus dipsaci TaxID=166011 RepID=A0A915ESC7_9BILA
MSHEFHLLDNFSEQASDRQLQVDIPRCHQYDELMTSPVAHYKLKLLLKGWLACQEETGYVYWQGLDSLAAPFLVLNFNNLPVAFNCLSAFINKYLHNFFLKDNSDTIQEYLAVFVLLLEFIDPELAFHLNELEFQPNYLPSPDASFPLFIGIAILIQLRPQLITAQFNDAILLFSDLPDICIDSVVASSLRFYHAVPSSCAHTYHTRTIHCVASLKSQLIALLNGASPQIAHCNHEAEKMLDRESEKELIEVAERSGKSILSFQISAKQTTHKKYLDQIKSITNQLNALNSTYHTNEASKQLISIVEEFTKLVNQVQGKKPAIKKSEQVYQADVSDPKALSEDTTFILLHLEKFFAGLLQILLTEHHGKPEKVSLVELDETAHDMKSFLNMFQQHEAQLAKQTKANYLTENHPTATVLQGVGIVNYWMLAQLIELLFCGSKKEAQCKNLDLKTKFSQKPSARSYNKLLSFSPNHL